MPTSTPWGTIEFALDFRENGFYRRVDVGIDPYKLPRVYLKTHDVTGSEGFLRCARHFFAGILTYFKEK